MPKGVTTPLVGGLAGALRTARLDRGRRQDELAETLGRGLAHVGQVERGYGRTDPVFLDRWAAELGYRWALIPIDQEDDHIGGDHVPHSAKIERQPL
jgi:transcriptional regulator with XRE-family HTH domain